MTAYQIQRWSTHGWVLVLQVTSLAEAMDDLEYIEKACPELVFRMVEVAGCEEPDRSDTKPTA